MEALKIVNLTVRFLLEIMTLIILGYWGFHVSQGTLMKVLIGIGTPLLVAGFWAMFGAPKAPYLLAGFSYFILEIVIFGLPMVALISIGKSTWATIYGIITVINLVLIKIWNQ